MKLLLLLLLRREGRMNHTYEHNLLLLPWPLKIPSHFLKKYTNHWLYAITQIRTLLNP